VSAIGNSLTNSHTQCTPALKRCHAHYKTLRQ